VVSVCLCGVVVGATQSSMQGWRSRRTAPISPACPWCPPPPPQVTQLDQPALAALCYPAGPLTAGAHPKTQALLAFLHEGYAGHSSAHIIVFTQTRQVGARLSAWLHRRLTLVALAQAVHMY
jgi:hypothetical protein